MGRARAAIGCGAAIALLAIVGCGDSTDDKTTTSAATGTSGAAATTATTSAPRVAPKIAVLMIVNFDYQQAEVDGIKEAAEREGGSAELFNANYDPQKLLSMCKDAINSGRFNAIVLSGLDPSTGVPCVTAAHAADIPVAGLDSTIGTDGNDLEPQVEGVVGGVYATPAGNAEVVVDLAKQACEGLDPCRIIAEIASPTDPLTNGLVEAVTKEVPNAEIVAKFASGFDVTKVTEKMPDILAANPNADVFLSIADGSALAALPAIKAAGLEGKIKLLGNGGSRDGAEAVADGTLFGSVGTWPHQQGEIVADMLTKALNDEPIDPVGIDQQQVDEPAVLTKDTISAFTPEWGASH